MPEPDKRVVMSVREMCGRLGVSVALGYDLVHQGVVPSIRLGKKRIVIPIAQFNEWLRDTAWTPPRGRGDEV
jgi:excisionase family DNA binding protein